MSWRLLMGVALLALASAPGSAQEMRMEIGLLTCSLAENNEARVPTGAASERRTQEMLCAFKPTNNGPEETYAGTLESIGQEQEGSARRVMIWVVKSKLAAEGLPGMLQQTYAADPAAIRDDAPRLIGETNSSIVLVAMADRHDRTTSDKKQPPSAIVSVTLQLRTTPA